MTASDGEQFRYGKDATGNRGIIITGEDGADTVIPFKAAGYVKVQSYGGRWCNNGVTMNVDLSDCSWYKKASKTNIQCGIKRVGGHGGIGADITIETYVSNYNQDNGIATIFIRGDIDNPTIIICMLP